MSKSRISWIAERETTLTTAKAIHPIVPYSQSMEW